MPKNNHILVGTRWRRAENWNGRFTYTVIAVTEARTHYGRKVIYIGDNGKWWVKDLKNWPGSLVEYVKD